MIMVYITWCDGRGMDRTRIYLWWVVKSGYEDTLDLAEGESA